MADKDTLGDLVHRAYNSLTGAVEAASTPDKPGYTSQDAASHLGGGMVAKGADVVSGRQAQIDKAVQDAGG